MTYAEEDGPEESAQAWTAFRHAEKRYQLFREQQIKFKNGKRRAGKLVTRPVDLSDVLDLHSSAGDHGNLHVVSHQVPGYPGPVFTFTKHPGLVYLPSALPPAQQHSLTLAALADYPEPPARTNHTRQYGPLPGLWRAAREGLRLNWTRKDDPHEGAARRLGCGHIPAKPHKLPDLDVQADSPEPELGPQPQAKLQSQTQPQLQAHSESPPQSQAQAQDQDPLRIAISACPPPGSSPLSPPASEGKGREGGAREDSCAAVRALTAAGYTHLREGTGAPAGAASDRSREEGERPGVSSRDGTSVGLRPGAGPTTERAGAVAELGALCLRGLDTDAGGQGAACRSNAGEAGEGERGSQGRQPTELRGGELPGELADAGAEHAEAGADAGCGSDAGGSRRSSGCGSADLYWDAGGGGSGGGCGTDANGNNPGFGPSFGCCWSTDGPGPPAELLLRKLRWATLGPQFDWTQRQYDFTGSYRPLPPTLELLARQLAAAVNALHGAGLGVMSEEVAGSASSGYQPDAAIVNYYQPGDMLGGHLDDVERDVRQPIVSVSLGCPAVFLMGGPDRDVAPTAIMLRGGDVLVLGGEARRCYHGVPRILEDRPHPTGATGARPAAAAVRAPAPLDPELYSRCARINISIRAVK